VQSRNTLIFQEENSPIYKRNKSKANRVQAIGSNTDIASLVLVLCCGGCYEAKNQKKCLVRSTHADSCECFQFAFVSHLLLTRIFLRKLPQASRQHGKDFKVKHLFHLEFSFFIFLNS
jgi:hypothetical protein